MFLGVSDRVKPLLTAVTEFIAAEIEPREAAYFGEVDKGDRWVYSPLMTEMLEGLKNKARERGLWNFFLAEEDQGPGLTNVEYAHLAEAMGWSPLAPEVFNCSAPDTGNMEILARFGTSEQKTRWLAPLLAGEIRSAFAMTEPDVASSDAGNISARAVAEGDVWVIDGEKTYITGAGDPRCKVLICMLLTNPENPKYQRHSQILVPMDTPGLSIVRPMCVFGADDAPHGHMHLRFENVRVPRSNVILGAGRGFEVAQNRLGPGRIHHCMRSIGAAEKALQLLCRRSLAREAFGKPLADLGGNLDAIADARIEIEMSRLLTLKAAWLMDTSGTKAARGAISQIKVVAPNVALKIIDRAIQIHGAAGLSQDFPLAAMWAAQRALRLADGPDEVHRRVVGRLELKKYH